MTRFGQCEVLVLHCTPGRLSITLGANSLTDCRVTLCYDKTLPCTTGWYVCALQFMLPLKRHDTGKESKSGTMLHLRRRASASAPPQGRKDGRQRLETKDICSPSCDAEARLQASDACRDMTHFHRQLQSEAEYVLYRYSCRTSGDPWYTSGGQVHGKTDHTGGQAASHALMITCSDLKGTAIYITCRFCLALGICLCKNRCCWNTQHVWRCECNKQTQSAMCMSKRSV
jgi:hypothetical protein